LKQIWLSIVIAIVSLTSAHALDLDGPVIQGALRMGQVAPGASVQIDGKPVRVTPVTGQFVFGVAQDRKDSLRIQVTDADGTIEQVEYVVTVRQYDIERIDGLPARKVTPNPLDLERIRREGRLISAARARDTELTHVLSGFAWPVTGRISGRYGNQRILNGKPRRAHLGIDIAAPQGTPVAASAPGQVSLAAADLFYTGGTIVIDHGHGVTTIYSHLADVSVADGQRVVRGEVIGTVGSTGRSTGPHLDWRINWFDLRLDPELITGPMPITK
jgi:murein DD-endopeptidase MepM/ murein hydrolase activator NlpD